MTRTGYIILRPDGTAMEQVYNTTAQAAQAVYALDPDLKLGYKVVAADGPTTAD